MKTLYTAILSFIFLFCVQQGQAQISGDTAVCAGEKVTYYVTPVFGAGYSWSATGGMIYGSSLADSVVVMWGAAGTGILSVAINFPNNPPAFYFVNVSIHAKPSPAITHIPYPGCPSGGQGTAGGNPDHEDKGNCEKVCKNAIIVYATNLNAGSTYQWVASGGLVLSGATTNSPTVQWDTTAYGFLTVYETNLWGCMDSTKICVEKVDLPIAAFQHQLSVCRNSPVNFNNLSTGVQLTYQWYFGDGGYSTATNPVHPYTVAGTYTITLIAMNQCHCTDTVQSVITVDSLPGPDISCPSTLCAYDTATYATSVSGCTYTWIVLGGAIIGPSNLQTVVVAWGAGQMGTLGLVVGGCGSVCSDTTWVQIPILPAVAVIAGPAKVCPGDCVTYSIPKFSGATYTWTLNSGSCGSISDSSCCGQVEICYPSFGYPCNDTLTVTYFDAFLNCGGSATKIIRFRPKLAVFGLSEVCSASNAFFSAFPGTNCNWSVSPAGPVLSPSPAPNVNVNWMGLTGTFVITAVPQNPNQVCNDSASFVVRVLPSPAAPVISGDSVVCAGGTSQYCATASGNISWIITGGTPTSGTGNCITVTWGNSGPFLVQAINTMTASPFCPSDTATYNVNVLVTVPVPVINGSHAACANLNTSYSTAVVLPAGSSFDWSLNPANAGSITSGQNTNAIQIEWGNNAPQTVVLTLTVTACGIPATDTFHIALNPIPVPVAIQNGTLCQGGTASLAVTGGVFSAYIWSGPGGFSSTLAVPVITLEGLYQVTVTGGGCDAISQVNVHYVGNPLASITAQGPLVYCIGSAYVVNLCALGNPGYTYAWSNGPVTQCNPISSPGTFNVTVTDANGCFAVSNPLSVSEDSCNSGGPGCQPGGSVSFTHSSCNPKVFANTSVNAASFFWDFGDFTTSNQASPTHTYLNAGFYLVTLWAHVPDMNGGDSCLLADTALIEIPLVSKFDIKPDCFGKPVCFVDKSVYTAGNSITSWLWNFGDATFSSSPSPCHTYALPGTYLVSLTISNGSCVTSHTDTVFVRPQPTAAFSFSNNACVNSSVIFNDLSFTNVNYWNWTFGNGGTSLNQNPSQTYMSGGTYPVTLIVHDKYGCYDTVSQGITINAPIASGNITASPDTIVCAGTSVLLVAPGCTGCTHSWNNGSTNDSIVVTQTGIYTVNITDTNGCVYSTHIKIIVLQKPQAVITASKPKLCQGEYAFLNVQYNPKWLYNWISTDPGVNGQQTASVSTFPVLPGTYSYQVAITDTSTGCSDTTLIYYLTVYAPPVAPTITALGPVTVCKGDTITLVATHPDLSITFKWNTGEINDTIGVIKSGCYTVIVTDTNGCTAQAVSCVTVNPLPEVCSFYEGCFDTCAPYLIQGPAGGTAYQWYMNGIPIAINGNSQNYLASLSGVYSLAITNAFGCSDTTGNLNLSLYACNDSLCADFIIDTIYCDKETGHYTLKYHVINLSPVMLTEVNLQVLPPALYLAYAPTLVLQPILPGDTSTQLTATIFNGLPGSTICFRTHVSAYDSTGYEILCCTSDSLCITLPDCHTDTACCSFNIVSDSIWCVTNPEGIKEYKFKFDVKGCGKLTISPINNGPITLNNPYLLTGGITTITGTYTSNTDSILCLVFTVGNGVVYCADTTICFVLPDCPPPVAPCKWEFTRVICQGDSAVFQYFIYMPGTTYTWNFPGGVPASAFGMGPHTIHYPTPGTFPVQLIITNAQGSTDCVDSIVVVPRPVASITVSGNTLIALPGSMSYQWYFSPPTMANLIAGATNQFFLPVISDTYCVVVTNANHCKDTACIDFEIPDTNCCYFKFLGDSIWCETSPEGIKEYHFKLKIEGCGVLNIVTPNVGPLALANPYIMTGGIITINGIYNSPTDSILCLTFVVNNDVAYCTDTTICFHLPDCPPPTLPCSWEYPHVICQGQTAVFNYFVYMPGTTYAWTFPGGSPAFAFGMGPHAVTYANPGTYAVQLTITNAQGSTTCIDSILVVPLPVASITVSGNMLLANPAGMNYQWYTAPPSPGNLIPGAINQFYTPLTAGNYCVVVSNANHCMDTACIHYEIPDTNCCYFGLISDSLWCVYTPEGLKEYHFKLKISGCGIMNILPLNNGPITLNNPYIMTGGITTITGTYTSATDSVLCLTFLVGNAVVYCADTTICLHLPDCPPPSSNCDWSGPTEICAGSTAVFQYTGPLVPGATYSWLFPGGIPATATGPGPHSVTYPNPGAYSIVLTINAEQCCNTCTGLILVDAYPQAVITQSGNTLLATPAGYLYQWYLGNPGPGNLIAGATNQFYVPTQAGNHCIIVKNPIGCADTACYAFAPMGVDVVVFGNSSITVNPNPTRGELTIQLQGDYQNILVEISNMTGQVVATKTVSHEHTINMNIEGQAGMYYVKVRNERGQQAIFKVIKR